MIGNRDVNDFARADEVTAFIMRVASASEIDGLMCVRRVEPACDFDGETFPPRVVYECRRRQDDGRWVPQRLTFDDEIFHGCTEAECIDPVICELEAVFG